MKDIRCIICGKEYLNAEIGDMATKCPNCGTECIPCDVKDDVDVKINWHELRILGIWAENWARQIDKDLPKEDERNLLTIMTIAERLQNQHPDKTPLTLFGEMKELRKEFGDENVVTEIDDDSLLGL